MAHTLTGTERYNRLMGLVVVPSGAGLVPRRQRDYA